jgi:molybdopterin converting factor subunit 1
MTIAILYFGRVREGVGAGEEALPLDAPITLDAVLKRIMALSPAHAEALADRDALRFAINQDMASVDALVRPGDEVAIFPPVTGG